MEHRTESKILRTLSASALTVALMLGMGATAQADTDAIAVDGADTTVYEAGTTIAEQEGTTTISVDGVDTTVYEVSSGFCQDGEKYSSSTNFYITSKAGLEYFRDLVSACDGGTVVNSYVSTWTGSTNGIEFYKTNIFTGKTAHLLVDIDLQNEDWTPIGYVNTAFNSRESKTYFYGDFNGHGHTISNLKLKESPSNNHKSYGSYGLFGVIGSRANQTFSHLTIQNVSGVTGTSTYDYVGAIVGNAGSNAVFFDDCHVKGEIALSSSYQVGGIYGIGSGTLTNCSTEGTGTISSEHYYAAGLAGCARKGVIVSGSTVAGVTIQAPYAGGLTSLNNSVAQFDSNTIKDAQIVATVTAGFNDCWGTPAAAVELETVATNITIPLTGISITPNGSSTLFSGETRQLGIAPVPERTTESEKFASLSAPTWASSDTDVVTVNGSGFVTPVGSGSAKITATTGEYSATYDVTVSGTAKVIDVDGTTVVHTYGTLAEAIAAATPGQTISLSGDDFELPATAAIAQNVTITGEGKDNTTLVITTENGDGVKIANSGVAIKNVTIDGRNITDVGYNSLVNVKADGCVIDNVIMIGGGDSSWNSSILVETLTQDQVFTVANSTISGSFRGVLRESCNANIVIRNCDIDAVYPFNIDGGNGGSVTVEGGALHGWTSYGGVDKVSFSGVEFSEGDSGYNVVAAYENTDFESCEFNTGNDSAFDVYAQISGFTFTFNDCEKDGQQVTDQNLKELFSDPAVWSECETAIDVKTTDDGKYTSGTVVSASAPACAEGSVSLKTGVIKTEASGSDAATESNVFKIGTRVEVTEPTLKSATESSAIYAVELKLFDADNRVIYEKQSQEITLVKGENLASISEIGNLSGVVKAGLANVGPMATDVSTITLSLRITPEAATEPDSCIYDVKPFIVVKDASDRYLAATGISATEMSYDVVNAALSGGFAFELSTDSISSAATGDPIRVLHHSDDPTYADSTKIYHVREKESSRYIEITTDHFSRFTLQKTARIQTTGLTIAPPTALVKPHDKATLSAVLTPEDSTDEVFWSSSDESVATVDVNGVVTGVANGMATITAKTSEAVKATSTVYVADVAASSGLVYNGEDQALVTASAITGCKVLFAIGADSATVPAGEWSESVPNGKNAGDYFVWYKVSHDASGTTPAGESAPACVTVAIGKAAAVVSTAPAVKTLNWTGEAQELVVPGSVEGGAIEYSLDGATWSAAVPTASDPGTYTVHWRVVGDANHYSDVTDAVVTSTIGAKPGSEPVKPTYVAASGSGSTWTKGSKDGLAITFKRSVEGEEGDSTFLHFRLASVDGNTLTEGSDYTKAEGSVIVTLTPTYLEKLATGGHILSTAFDDGAATAEFSVVEQAAPESSSASASKTSSSTGSSPKTYDPISTTAWLICLGINAFALVLARWQLRSRAGRKPNR